MLVLHPLYCVTATTASDNDQSYMCVMLLYSISVSVNDAIVCFDMGHLHLCMQPYVKDIVKNSSSRIVIFI